MISLTRKRELLDKCIEVSQPLDILVGNNVLSRDEADKKLFEFLHLSIFTEEESQWLLSQIGIPSEKEEEAEIDRLLSSIVEYLIEMDSIYGEPVIHLKLYPSLGGKVSDEDGETLICYESLEDCVEKMQAYIKMNYPTYPSIDEVVHEVTENTFSATDYQDQLSDDERAIIYALLAKSSHRCTEEERELAYSMVARGLLEQEETFSVTEYGVHLFNQAD
jgi:hypothetical protein